MQHQGRVTASCFGEIIKRKVQYAPLVIRLLFSKSCITKAMKYGHDNEPTAQKPVPGISSEVSPQQCNCTKDRFSYRFGSYINT